MTWTFLAPARLWLLIGVGVLAIVYALLQLRGTKYAVRFTNISLLDSVAPKRPRWRRHVVAAVFLLSLSVMVMAYAQPADEVEVPVERATVMLAIDTSLSMEADDIDPSRIEAAQTAAIQFLDTIPDGLHVGLVTFNGEAVVQVSPTTDHQAVRDAIDEIELDESTAIGEAVFASLDAIETTSLVEEDGSEDGQGADEDGQTSEPPATIVVMSDGETTVGRPTTAAIPEAQAAGIPVSTISFGTPEGVIEVDIDGTGIPSPVPVPVDEGALRELAEETGGKFFTAETAGELSEVYADLGKEIGSETEEVEVTARYVGAALVALALTATLSLVWFNRVP
ncbi:MAG: hypothetical protein JJLCMIEE_02276 [Acidimicrobiales bacterium]|nr:MAG: VWA domain-containing protein [Actinomycetota bacterium]MBV6509208.1 hypothetical protein [Acidimicrobiales bacterium]RIK08451.1 MAG: VWA domain-containing protein [Acidobacteriota bacterium]